MGSWIRGKSFVLVRMLGHAPFSLTSIHSMYIENRSEIPYTDRRTVRVDTDSKHVWSPPFVLCLGLRAVFSKHCKNYRRFSERRLFISDWVSSKKNTKRIVYIKLQHKASTFLSLEGRGVHWRYLSFGGQWATPAIPGLDAVSQWNRFWRHFFFFLHVKPSNIDFYFSYNGIRWEDA